MTDGSGAGRRLHPLTFLIGPLMAIRGWLVPLAIALAIGGVGRAGQVLGGFLIFLIPLGVSVVGQVIGIIRLRYRVTGTDLHLRTGVLETQERTIPLDRIQNVNLTEPALARLFGLAAVVIETAGAAGDDVKLSYVKLPEAERLRALLASPARFSGEEAALGDDVVFEAPVSELVLAGATANRVGTLTAMVGAAIAYSDDLGWSGDLFSWVEDQAGAIGRNIVVVAGVVLVLSMLIGWVASIAGTVTRFYGFRLVRRGDDLHRSHGLLSRSSGLIPLQRVQLVSVHRPLLWRLLGRASVVASTAGSPGKADSGVGVVAPIAENDQVARLIDRVLPGVEFDDTNLLPVSRLTIRRGFIRAALPGLVGFGGAAFFDLRFLMGALIWAVAAFGWAQARYAALGYRLDNDQTLTARAGVLTRSTWVVPESKVQAVAVVSSFFQRRLGLASVLVETAGTGAGRVSIVDLEHAMARRLADHLSVVSAATAFANDGV